MKKTLNSLSWYVPLTLLMLFGCMMSYEEVRPTPSPGTGTSAQLIAIRQQADVSVSALAAQIAANPALSDSDQRNTWNQNYTKIMAESGQKATDLLKSALDAAPKSPERQAVWLEIQKAYK